MTMIKAIFSFHTFIFQGILCASMKPNNPDAYSPQHICSTIAGFIGYSWEKLDLVIGHEGWKSSQITDRLKTMNIMLELKNMSATSFLDFLEKRKIKSDLPLVVLLIPADRRTLTLLLSQISKFYTKNPDQTPMVYFFVVWSVEEQHEKSVIEETLASAIPNAPLHSHLYIMLPEHEANLALWEFYRLKTIVVFQQVQMAAPTDFMRRVIRRGDFRGMVVRGLLIMDTTVPIVAKIRLPNGSVGVTGESGLALEAFQLLERCLNFKMHYTVGEGIMTIVDKDGQLQGTGRQVYDGEKDVLLSFDTEILPFRLEWLASSQPVISHRIQAFYKKMDTSLYRNVLYDAFSLSVWGTVAGSAVVICICFLILDHGHRRYRCKSSSVEKGPVFWTFAVFCQQAWQYPCTRTSTQIVSVVALIASLLYYTAYSASIVSLLAVDVNPIKDTRDLVERGYTLYANRYSMTGLNYIMNGDIRYENVFGRQSYLEFEESVSKINSSKSAFLNVRYAFMGASLELNYTLRDICTWITHTTLPSDAIQQHGAVFFRKFDPLKKYFDYHLGRWRGSGILRHYNGFSDRTPTYQCDPPRKEPKELSYADVRGAVNILLVGLVCSLLILGLESVVKDTKNERTPNDCSSDKNASTQNAISPRQ